MPSQTTYNDGISLDMVLSAVARDSDEPSAASRRPFGSWEDSLQLGARQVDSLGSAPPWRTMAAVLAIVVGVVGLTSWVSPARRLDGGPRSAAVQQREASGQSPQSARCDGAGVLRHENGRRALERRPPGEQAPALRQPAWCQRAPGSRCAARRPLPGNLAGQRPAELRGRPSTDPR